MKDWAIEQKIIEFLDEDLGYGDLTSELICGDELLTAEITAKEDFVVSGVEEAEMVFQKTGCEVKLLVNPGDDVSEGTVLMRLKGTGRELFAAERLALNLIMRMSGIATKVNRMVEKAQGAKIAATRKTTPGFRIFEKRAVIHGGGDPHRNRLDDMVLIKDNHIKSAGGLEKAVGRARKKSFSKKIDVEVATLEQAKKAAELGVDIIMLDNMTPGEVEECAREIRAINEDILVEVSGGITEDNVSDYGRYADILSSGSITHSVSSVDISMNVVEGQE